MRAEGPANGVEKRTRLSCSVDVEGGVDVSGFPEEDEWAEGFSSRADFSLRDELTDVLARRIGWDSSRA